MWFIINPFELYWWLMLVCIFTYWCVSVVSNCSIFLMCWGGRRPTDISFHSQIKMKNHVLQPVTIHCCLTSIQRRRSLLTMYSVSAPSLSSWIDTITSVRWRDYCSLRKWLRLASLPSLLSAHYCDINSLYKVHCHFVYLVIFAFNRLNWSMLRLSHLVKSGCLTFLEHVFWVGCQQINLIGTDIFKSFRYMAGQN